MKRDPEDLDQAEVDAYLDAPSVKGMRRLFPTLPEFPEPDYTSGGRPYWHRHVVKRWLTQAVLEAEGINAAESRRLDADEKRLRRQHGLAETSPAPRSPEETAAIQEAYTAMLAALPAHLAESERIAKRLADIDALQPASDGEPPA